MDELEMQFTGAVQSPKDDRDFDFGELASGISQDSLPLYATYDRKEVSAYHQRKVPSCVNNAMYKGVQLVNYEESNFRSLLDLSPRAGHAYCMALSKLPLGSGMYPRLAMDVLRNIGAYTQKALINDSKLKEEDYILWSPTAKDDEDAKPNRIASYSFVKQGDVQALVKALYTASTGSRTFVVALMRVGDTYWIDEAGKATWDKERILPIRRPKEVTSGHQILLTGYRHDEGRLVIEFLNSWGDTWADNGRGWFYLDEHLDLMVEVIVGLDKDALTESFSYQFTKNLRKGDRGQDVFALQTFLKKEGFFKGDVTQYFGDVTFKAVCDFQEKYRDEVLTPNGLTKPTGFFGEASRKKANSM